MITPNEYVNMSIPPEWLPETLATKKIWTFGELAQDRTTKWLGQNRYGNPQHYTPRQLLHIWESLPPHKIADLSEDEQQMAIQRQHIAHILLEFFPSQSEPKKSEPKKPKEKKKSVPTVTSV